MLGNQMYNLKIKGFGPELRY